jgi:hypothetical protein
MEVWKLCKQSNFVLDCDWISRRFNVLADEQSKVWDRLWVVNPGAMSLAKTLSRWLQVFTPKFTRIGMFLTSLRQRCILIFPVWKSQSWWPLLQKQCVKSIVLGNFQNTFEVNLGYNPPDWEFKAAIVKPYSC